MQALKQWMQSGQTAHIRGAKLCPKPDPQNPNKIYKEKGTQGVSYHLLQKSKHQEWILKKFRAEAHPDYSYLVAIRSLVPKHIAFACASKRVVLSDSDVKDGAGLYFSEELGKFVNNCILMQKVDGESWETVSENLKSGKLAISPKKRVELAKSLANAIELLANEGCAHRDLSHRNVFLDLQEYVVYLVDWDSMFHGSLYFHKNTPAGTPGYIAPWVKSGNDWDARKSWNKRADRFALALLIAEFLLTDNESKSKQEGVLFSGQMFLTERHSFIAKTIQSLYEYSERLGDLFQQTITASSYEECPEPIHWLEALNEIRAEDTVPESEETEQEEEEEFIVSGGKSRKSGWNYWILSLIVLLPVLMLVFSEWQGSSKNPTGTSTRTPTRTQQVNPNNTQRVATNNTKTSNVVVDDPINNSVNPVVEEKIPTTNPTEDKSRSEYLVKIFYPQDDLQLFIGKSQYILDKDNSIILDIVPGTYPVRIYFSGVRILSDGSFENTGPANYSDEVNFGKQRTIHIRVDRIDRTWTIIPPGKNGF